MFWRQTIHNLRKPELSYRSFLHQNVVQDFELWLTSELKITSHGFKQNFDFWSKFRFLVESSTWLEFFGIF